MLAGRHFLAAVRAEIAFSTNSGSDVQCREFPTILLGEKRQVGWRRLECARCGASALAASTLTEGAVAHVDFCSRGE